VGEESYFMDETVHISSKFDPRETSFIRIPECGHLITQENPNVLVQPLKLFLNGMGYF